MKLLLLTAFALSCGPAAWSANKLIVKKVEGDIGSPNGVVYALSKTVVAVDVTIKKTTVKAGKFAADTDKFFDLKPKEDYPLADSKRFAADSAAFKSRQLADKDEVYSVKLTKEWMKDHHFALELADDGTLTKGEITITNRRTDFLLSILGTVASIAGKFIGAAALKSAEAAQDVASQCDAIVLQAAHKPAEAAQTTEPARRAFCEIVRLSRRREDIVLGHNSVSDGTAALLQDIDLQLKKRFSDYFTGSRTEATWTARFEDIPAAGTAPGPVPLLTFVAECGVKPPGASSIDTEIPDGLADSDCTSTQRTEHALSLTYVAPPAGSLHSRFRTQEPEEHSFAFRIPAAYQVNVKESFPQTKPDQSVTVVERLVARGPMAVSQLGVIGYLPSDVGGKKSSITVTLHASGALKSVDVGVEAQGNIAETAGTAATGLVDAELARRKAAKDEADEVAQAEKKQKLLEAQVAAMRAQCILDGKCPLNPE